MSRLLPCLVFFAIVAAAGYWTAHTAASKANVVLGWGGVVYGLLCISWLIIFFRK